VWTNQKKRRKTVHRGEPSTKKSNSSFGRRMRRECSLTRYQEREKNTKQKKRTESGGKNGKTLEPTKRNSYKRGVKPSGSKGEASRYGRHGREREMQTKQQGHSSEKNQAAHFKDRKRVGGGGRRA